MGHLYPLIKDTMALNKNSNVPMAVMLVLLMTAVHPTLHVLEEMGPNSEQFNEKRSKWVEIYVSVGDHLPAETVLLTGLDITMGLHAETPAYRYENPEYPVLHALHKFESTHIFTQNSNYRYDIDVNATFLLGSPADPDLAFEKEPYIGLLWEVNQTRLNQADYWQNTSVEIFGDGQQHGDFAWLEQGATFLPPENSSVSRIYATHNDLQLLSAFDVLANNRSALLCDSVVECSVYDRTDQIELNWGVWFTETVS